MRNYREEYREYQSQPKQIKRRASRNKARRMMVQAGKAHKGDDMDVEHKNGNPMVDKLPNLKEGSKKDNRSYARTKTAGKVNPKS